MDRQSAGLDSRHYCSHEGCERSFIRKEHLTRHALSHTENPSYICNICSRAFTRNDVLQKHVRGHTARQKSTERNKRACQPCHKAKTRCAGGFPCQSCVKRRIPCIFDNASGMSSGRVQESISSGSSSTGCEQPQGQIRRDPYNTSEPQASQYDYSASQYSASYQHEKILSIASTSSGYAGSWPSPQQLFYNTNSYTPSQPIVNWQPTSQYQLPPPNSGYLNRPHATLMEGGSEAGEQYFSHFHPRWPIIHMSSYDESDAQWTLNYSVVMVGNDLIGSNENEAESYQNLQ